MFCVTSCQVTHVLYMCSIKKLVMVILWLYCFMKKESVIKVIKEAVARFRKLLGTIFIKFYTMWQLVCKSFCYNTKKNTETEIILMTCFNMKFIVTTKPCFMFPRKHTENIHKGYIALGVREVLQMYCKCVFVYVFINSMIFSLVIDLSYWISRTMNIIKDTVNCFN